MDRPERKRTEVGSGAAVLQNARCDHIHIAHLKDFLLLLYLLWGKRDGAPEQHVLVAISLAISHQRGRNARLCHRQGFTMI